MDLWKFEDMLAKSALYFARQDRFKDEFEGRFTEGNSGEFSASDKALYEAYRLNRSMAEAREQHELQRRCIFISCWHRNTRENYKLWGMCESGKDSVVVTTSANALCHHTPSQFLKSPVSYRGPEFPRTDFGWSTLAFYKLSAYSYEREFRLVRMLEHGESVCFEDPADHGRHVPIQLKKTVHRVITHPRADEALKRKVDGLLRVHLKGLSRENSSLEGL